jgi:CheY-like chemotaxis protein
MPMSILLENKMEKFFALYDDEETGMPNQKRAFDEATVRLKRNTSTRNIPVIISTACNVGDRADRALDAGAEEILYKAFYLTMLRDVLRTYLLA